MKKLQVLGLVLIALFLVNITVVDAYVSVKGYYRSNGTYVAPHVRSNPNGLKYDNYGYTPSQGLYNKTYGTRGATWDTPTYITDPNYYEGKALYDSNSSGSSIPSTYYSLPSSSTKTNKTSVPAHAHLNSYGSDWYCDSGYKTKYNSSFEEVGCEKIVVPKNAHLNSYGSDWYCDSGYKTKYNSSFEEVGCEKIIVPPHAHLSVYGSDWYCDAGYETKYDSNFKEVGCKKE
jgi:elongation factor P hydroxylase